MDIHYRKAQKRPQEAGFTLIELLAVMTVILILMGLVVSVARFSQQAARRAHARAEIEELNKILMNYKLADGAYPTELFDIRHRIQEGFRTNDLLGASYEIADPWEQPYQYNLLSPSSFELYSTGPNLSVNEDDIYSGK